MTFETYSADETYKVASEFAKQLKSGDVIALDGDLGAGKTAFVRGLAAGLGICDRVVSPTFTIVNEYIHGTMPLFHFDVYRIDGEDDLYDIGWDDYLNRGGVCVVEWAQITKGIFISPYYKIYISKDLEKDEDYRKITIEKV